MRRRRIANNCAEAVTRFQISGIMFEIKTVQVTKIVHKCGKFNMCERTGYSVCGNVLNIKTCMVAVQNSKEMRMQHLKLEHMQRIVQTKCLCDKVVYFYACAE